MPPAAEKRRTLHSVVHNSHAAPCPHLNFSGGVGGAVDAVAIGIETACKSVREVIVMW